MDKIKLIPYKVKDQESTEPIILSKFPFQIGRAEDNDLVLAYPEISRHHATILHENHQYSIRDENSANGTFINEERINVKTLTSDEIIRFAKNFEYKFFYEKPKPDIPDLLSQFNLSTPMIDDFYLLEKGGKKYFLGKDGKDTAIIGRKDNCDLIIPYTGISREHAKIELKANQLFVTDLGSTNGTFVNNQKVDKHRIEIGDEIGFGVYKFMLQTDKPIEEEKHSGTVIIKAEDVIRKPLKEQKKPIQIQKNNNMFIFLGAAGFFFVVGVILILYLIFSSSVDTKSKHTTSNNTSPEIENQNVVEVPDPYSQENLIESAIPHIIEGLKAYKEANWIKVTEQFDVAIDIIFLKQFTENGGELDTLDVEKNIEKIFKRINVKLPPEYQDIDVFNLYKTSRKYTKAVLSPLSIEEQETFVRQEISRIMNVFGEEDSYVPQQFLERINYFINRFQNKEKGFFERSLSRSQKYLPMIRKIFKENHLPEELAYLALIESGFIPDALSHAGARGLWQFMPKTAREYGLVVNERKDERIDPEKATLAASQYLRNLLFDFGTRSFMLAMAAYNAGEQRVRRALRKGTNPFEERAFWHIVEKGYLVKETNEYVPRIIAAMIIAKNPSIFGFEIANELATLIVPGGTSLVLISNLCNTTVEYLRSLNPSIPSDAITIPKAAVQFSLKIPAHCKEKIEEELKLFY